jgi:hypothetical protein
MKPIPLEAILILQEMLEKYKGMLNETEVMDDYDGGKAAALKVVIEDLERILLNE